VERSPKGRLTKGKTTHVLDLERGLGLGCREQLPNQWGATRRDVRVLGRRVS
jgi:hypothetical protein